MWNKVGYSCFSEISFPITFRCPMYRCWRKPHSVPDFDKNLTVSERTLIERLHKIVVWNALKSKFEIVLFFSLHLLCLMYYCNGWDWILYNPDFFQARVTITFILEIFHMITDNFKNFWNNINFGTKSFRSYNNSWTNKCFEHLRIQ